MKQFKLFTIMLATLLMVACNDDDDKGGTTEPVAPSLTAPTDGTAVAIDEDNLTSTLSITWDAADFGAQVAVQYEIQMDVDGGAFSSPAILATAVSGTSSSVTYSDLNAAVLNDLEQTAGETSAVDIRVVASSSGFDNLVSGVVGLSVTTFLPETVIAPVITDFDSDNVTLLDANFETLFAVNWSAADFGTEDPITYTVKLALSGEGIEGAIKVGETSEIFYDLTQEALNFYLDQNLGKDPNASVDVDFYVSAVAGVSSIDSDAKSATFTTIDAAATLPSESIWMTGYFASWGFDLSQVLGVQVELFDDGSFWAPRPPQGSDSLAFASFWYSADITDPNEVKFFAQKGFEPTGYGYGGNEGDLTPDLGVQTPNILIREDKHYLVTVKADDLKYKLYDISTWGIIGDATPGSWDASTAMTYNAETDTWEITSDLVNGALKFRANDGWNINLGARNANSLRGEPVLDAAAISIPTAGNYTIRLSFDTSVSPYKWNYDIVKN